QIIEQIAFEARHNEYVDKKSGVSARLTIAAYENAVSSAERRLLLLHEKTTQVWISDLQGIIPAITGKIELVYEGEQEGPYEVAQNLLEKSIRSIFTTHFPNPENFKKKRNNKKSVEEKPIDNPYQPIIEWFDKGNSLELPLQITDKEKELYFNQIDGLINLINQYQKNADYWEKYLYMELVLHGLAAHSLISKKLVNGELQFRDLMGSMVNLSDFDDLDM
ncbi:MAG: magnesium chelatase, partial [Chitinophagaceae bacterium]